MEKAFLNNKLISKFIFKNSFCANIFLANIRSMPIHMHDGVELLSVLKGSIEVKISFNSYTLREGDFLLINSLEVHGIEGLEPNEVILMEMGASLFEGRLYAFDIFFYRNFNCGKVNEVKDLMRSALNLNGRPEDGGSPVIGQMVEEIVSICDQYFQMQTYDVVHQSESTYASHSLNSERIKNVYEYLYIQDKSRKRLTDLAEMVNVDKCYASRLIKTGMGKSFQETLNIVRVDRAEVLLLGTDYTIQNISEMLNFSSTSYFCKVFKQCFSMAPLAYRNAHKGKTYPDKPMDYAIISAGACDLIKLREMMEFISRLQAVLSQDKNTVFEIDGCTAALDETRGCILIDAPWGKYRLAVENILQ